MQKKKAFTLVEILIIVAILAILATLTVPGIIRARVSAQDALAKNNLSVMAKATEVYATDNNGFYPSVISALLLATPAYLNRNYCGLTEAGFQYGCENTPAGYWYVATPVSLGFSGSTNFSISSGGVLVDY